MDLRFLGFFFHVFKSVANHGPHLETDLLDFNFLHKSLVSTSHQHSTCVLSLVTTLIFFTLQLAFREDRFSVNSEMGISSFVL